MKKLIFVLLLVFSLFSCNFNGGANCTLTISDPIHIDILDTEGNKINGTTLSVKKGQTFTFTYKQRQVDTSQVKREDLGRYAEFYDVDSISYGNTTLSHSDLGDLDKEAKLDFSASKTQSISINENTTLEVNEAIYILGQMIDRNKTYGEVEISYNNNGLYTNKTYTESNKRLTIFKNYNDNKNGSYPIMFDYNKNPELIAINYTGTLKEFLYDNSNISSLSANGVKMGCLNVDNYVSWYNNGSDYTFYLVASDGIVACNNEFLNNLDSYFGD